MHIVNSMAANFGNYDLDVSAVGMRSISETDIKLPYTGVLPVQMSASSGAYVYLNVQLAQGARLVLVAHGKGKDIKRPLEASSEEIIALLDGFFKQNQDATGLAQYWLGVWQAHYTEWRKIVTGPDRLLTILSSLSVTDREFLCKQHCSPDNCAVDSRSQIRNLSNQMQIPAPSCLGIRCLLPDHVRCP